MFQKIKSLLRKTIVDGATVILFLACLYSFVSGLGTFYASYYTERNLPSPQVFSSASQQFATAISLVFAMFLARKYRVDEKEKKTEEK